MKRLSLKILFALTVFCLWVMPLLAASTPELAWEIPLLKPGWGNAIGVDPSGNVIIAGHTNGKIGDTYFGGDDVFIAKYDSEGNQLWLKQFGTASDDVGKHLAVDSDGNTYVTGSTKGDLEGANLGGEDAFLAKFSPEGEQLWIRQFGTTTADIGLHVSLKIPGFCYVAGSTKGDLGVASGTRYNAFVMKYDTNGNLLETIQPYGTTVTYKNPVGFCLDEAGSIYMVGDPGFLAKSSPSGEKAWETALENHFSAPRGVDVVDNGEILVTGWTGGYVAMLNKLDNDGNQLWYKSFIRNGWSCPKVVIPFEDGSGDILIAGCQGANGAHCDGFMYKYSGTGENQWIVQNNTNYCGNAAMMDANGDCYFTGSRGGVGFLLKFKTSNTSTGIDYNCSCRKMVVIHQNYPNPFNPSTTIKYNLLAPGNVSLRIYNLSGQQISILNEGFQSAGEKAFTWVAEGLPAGIYFYKLIANGFSETRKVILQK